MKSSRLARLHPITLAVYFACVLGLTMIQTHPLSLLISAVCAFLLAFSLGARRFLWILTVGGLTVLANALLSRSGQTVLFSLFGLPVSAEALAFGTMSALLMIAVLLWFSCISRLLTTEKILCLFAGKLPSFCLLFVLTLRFVPRFSRQAGRVYEAQIALGAPSDTLRAKWRLGISVLSALIAWAFENAVETADSMRARGHGLSPRTSFASRAVRLSDVCAILLTACLCGVSVIGQIGGAFSVYYYPVIVFGAPTALTLIPFGAFAVLCLFPLILQLRGALWTRSLSKT